MREASVAIRLAIVSLALLAGAAFVARSDRSEPIPVRDSFSRFPMQIDAWSGRKAEDFDSKILTILGVDEYLNRVYFRPGEVPLSVYIGYYQSQRQGDSIHSPLNCMPGAGWEPVSKRELTIPVTTSRGVAQPISINRYLIQKGGDRQLVLYWYQGHGRVVASEYWSKIYMVLDAIRSNRTDAALVRVITPVPDGSTAAEAEAERRASEFVKAMFPLLGHYLPS
jgi:EpsI family protein